MHILLVDDEKLARQRLQGLLAELPQAMSIRSTEVADVMQAMQALAREQIDVVLLDIHMPGISGLNLAREVRQMERPPQVIFITAHAEHALQAFELDAVDYLTKPVNRERLEQALAKAERNLQANKPRLQDEQMVIIHDRGRIVRVPLSEVLYFKAELKYITVRTAEHSYILDGTLGDIEQKHGDAFLRIHRNALVARHAITSLDRDHSEGGEGDSWVIRVRGIPEVLAVSRRQMAAVRAVVAMRP